MASTPAPSPSTLHYHIKHPAIKKQNIIIEHRRFKRINIETLQKLTPFAFFPNDPTPYPVLNLSFTGLFIQNQINYKKGTVLNIELEIPAIGKIPMAIYILWINSSKLNRNNKEIGCGAEILEISPKYKQIWARFIKTCHLLIEIKELYQKLQKEPNK
jgi:Tfp pilus assembly protein PilZ